MYRTKYCIYGVWYYPYHGFRHPLGVWNVSPWIRGNYLASGRDMNHWGQIAWGYTRELSWMHSSPILGLWAFKKITCPTYTQPIMKGVANLTSTEIQVQKGKNANIFIIFPQKFWNLPQLILRIKFQPENFLSWSSPTWSILSAIPIIILAGFFLCKLTSRF